MVRRTLEPVIVTPSNVERTYRPCRVVPESMGARVGNKLPLMSSNRRRDLAAQKEFHWSLALASPNIPSRVLFAVSTGASHRPWARSLQNSASFLPPDVGPPQQTARSR